MRRNYQVYCDRPCVTGIAQKPCVEGKFIRLGAAGMLEKMVYFYPLSSLFY